MENRPALEVSLTNLEETDILANAPGVVGPLSAVVVSGDATFRADPNNPLGGTVVSGSQVGDSELQISDANGAEDTVVAHVGAPLENAPLALAQGATRLK